MGISIIHRSELNRVAVRAPISGCIHAHYQYPSSRALALPAIGLRRRRARVVM